MSAKNNSSRDTASRFRQVIICILAAALSLAGALPALGDAPPGLPSSFWGTVTLDGGNVPDGTIVSAWINGVQYAETAAFANAGQSVYTIDVPADDPLTVGVIEGGADEDAIVFKIGGSTADQTGTWQRETNSELDLSAITVIAFTPTPTATPTPSATPTQTPTRRITPTPSATSSPVVQTKTYQHGVDGYWGVADTHIDAWNPTRNYANEGKLIVRQGGVRSTLIRFDLSEVPAGHQVIEAKLSMYVCDVSATRPMRASLYTLNRPWVAAQATWLRASGAEMWGAAGAESVSDDRSAEAVDGVELSSTRTWYQFDVTEAVRQWIAHPETNYGLIIKGDGGVSVQYRLFSSNWVQPALRPKLVILYKSGSAEPTPTLSPTVTRTPTTMPTFTLAPTLGPTATPRSTVTPTRGPSATPTSSPVVQTKTYQHGVDGYWGVADTHIDAWNPTRNYANEGKLIVRQGGVRSTLIRFDLSEVPAGHQVIEAKLSMYVCDVSATRPMRASLYTLNRPWVAAQATWLRASGAEMWGAAGAESVSDDRSAETVDGVELSSTRTWYQFDVTEAVRQWIAHPETNYGLIIKGDGGVSVQYRLFSSNWVQPALRPKLVILYKGGSAEPTPTLSPTVTRTPTTMPTFTLAPTLGPTATPRSTVTPTRGPSATPTSPPVVQTKTYQHGVDGYWGVADTHIDAWNPTRNYANEGKLIVRQGGVRSTLIRFDLSEVPAGHQVIEAKLSMYVCDVSATRPMRASLYTLNRPWVAAQATWLRASGAEMWGAAGAESVSDDRSAEAVDGVELSSTRTWYQFDVTEAVRQWIAHPETNYGLIIKGDGGVSVQYRLFSSNWVQPALRPKLVILYY